MATNDISDASGTIAAGNVSQQLLAAQPDRRFLLIENVHATEDMWINFGIPAVQNQPSILIKAGGGVFIMTIADFISTQTINIIATTLGHPFTCKYSVAG